MIRCESIGCSDRAFIDCSFVDYEGRMRRMKLCLLHKRQLTRHSWYVQANFLYVVYLDSIYNDDDGLVVKKKAPLLRARPRCRRG